MPLRTCWKTGKVRYGSAIVARIHLNQAIAAGRPEQRRYQCEFCGGWHLTSKDWQPKIG